MIAHLPLENPARTGDAIQWANLLVGTLIGAAIGFLLSRATAWLDRAIQQRKVACNLLQETRRIRDELGKHPDHIVLRGGQDLFQVPRVHQWMQALVPEAALIHGDVVGDFMRLDRELNNLTIVREWYVEGVRSLYAVQSEHGADSEKYRDARDEVSERRQDFNDGNTKVTGLLDRIDQELRPYASAGRVGLLRRLRHGAGDKRFLTGGADGGLGL